MATTTRDRDVEYSVPHDRDFAILRELETAGLIKVSPGSSPARETSSSLDEFMKRAEKMPQAYRSQYENSSGWRFPASTEAKELAEYDYRLTESGRVAWDTVIASVAEQLTAEGEVLPAKTRQ